MSLRERKIFWPIIILAVCSLTALVIASARTRLSIARVPLAQVPSPLQSPSQSPSPIASAPHDLSSRLARQPEAFRQSRLLGKRFLSARGEQSVLIGTLTIGQQQQALQVTRHQDATGERVDITVANGTVVSGPSLLTWNVADGARSSSSPATGAERALIERIVLDSPDQFVLAQLRGASYYTIARQVRPEEAGSADNYTGPVWDIVRVGEPASSGQSSPQSSWRLYYINSKTGLIEKVISEEQGEQIIAEFSNWVDQSGEKIPTSIVWKRQGQVVMRFDLTGFSHLAQQ